MTPTTFGWCVLAGCAVGLCSALAMAVSYRRDMRAAFLHAAALHAALAAEVERRQHAEADRDLFAGAIDREVERWA